MPIASLTTNVASNLLIALRATIGWQAVSGGRTNVIFKIWRGAPVTGTLIFSAEDSGESGFDRNRVTSFSHVDSGFTASQPVTYTLTVETPDAGRIVNIVGPVTFTAAVEPA